MKIDLYTQKGDKNGTLDLPKEIFEVPFNKDLIHQALVRQLANGRVAIAHAKSKGEIRGGGRKPYAQKGTGRARQGSTRNPHMRGGGVAFGPRNVRNFELMMPKNQRRKALLSALSVKAKNNQIIGLEGYEADKPKTSEFAKLLKKLPVEQDVLILIAAKNVNLQKSTKNLSNAKTIIASYINIQDLQKYQKVLLFKDAIALLKDTFVGRGGKKSGSAGSADDRA